MKTCFKCLRVLERSEFYRNHRMSDGLMGKCKSCTCADVRRNYAERRENKSTYERARFKTPHRKALVALYQKAHRVRHPERYRARTALNNAVRDGRLERRPCVHCGTRVRVQAHHHDYSKPLDVTWACFICHREIEHAQVVVSERRAS